MADKIKLNLGCGIMCFAGWINVDKYLNKEGIKSKKGWYANAVWEDGAVFVQADILKMPFPDNYADVAEMHEVLEHFAMRDIIPALTEVYRVLKPGGQLIFNTPSFDGLAFDWLRMSMYNKLETQADYDEYINIAQTIYGNQMGDGEFHKVPFNISFLNYCIVQAGFKKGDFVIYKKGVPTPDVGELGCAKPGHVLRNDTIVGYITK